MIAARTITGRTLALLLAGWLAVLAALFPLADAARHDITRIYLHRQDVWLLGAGALLWLAALAALRWRPAAWSLPRWAPPVLAAGLFALGWAGYHAVLAGYHLSRDEQMVDFDALIYAHGLLAWPVPPQWRADLPALNTLFIPPVARPVAWVSAYLPGNALLHAWLGGAAGPLSLAVSVLALWGIARRLFGQDREAAVVALVLFALSGEVLLGGMSLFAMPAHLACNLVWLWLFLRDERRADLAALALGFFATGLHQPLFHPMAVAPWLALLVWQRRWGRLALFVPVYGAIGLFWLWWPHITLAQVMGPGSSINDAGAGYLSRLLDTLRQNNHTPQLMAANLLRLVGWSHLALWPLVLLGAGLWRKPPVAALLACLLLPLAVMTAILPYQGHGFGYRYLHAQMGDAALLGAYGWQRLGAWRDRLRGGLVVASLGSALVLLPMQLRFAHNFYDAYAEISAKIDAAPADYVLIGSMDAPLALDLVYNRPDLANRPLRLSDNDIEDSDRLAARICAPRADGTSATIALPRRTLYYPVSRALGVWPGRAADQRLPEARSQFEDAGCKVIELP